MRVVRGRADAVDADRERTGKLAGRVAESGVPVLRVWRPHRQVSFGRRDRRSDGYERAKEVARDHGYAVTEREVGGRAVAFTGETLAVVLAEPVPGDRTGIQRRYDRVLDALQSALAAVGVDTERGEPSRSFCPGAHSLEVDDGTDRAGKVAGVAQRVRQDVAVVGAVILTDGTASHRILAPVYAALDVPLDPTAVGSVSSAVGQADPRPLTDAVASTVADAAERDARAVRNT